MELRLDAVNSSRRVILNEVKDLKVPVILSDSEGSRWTKEILRSLRSLRMTKGCVTLNEVKDLKVPVILSDSEGSHWTKEILRSLRSLRMTEGCVILNEVKDLVQT